jgi:hypothetical protein
MASNDYQFFTHWRLTGTTAHAYDLLADVPGYRRWWSSVYLNVKTLSNGDAHGLGYSALLLTKGKLPYTIRWQMRVSHADYPNGFTIEAEGDFVGRGIWTFTQDGGHVKADFDWKLRAEKPLLRSLSFIFKPIFRANHFWAMARGEEGIRALSVGPHDVGTADRTGIATD